LNRLITTFDEVPPYLLNAIHIANNAISLKRSWCNLCKRVPPKSFVQPLRPENQGPKTQAVKSSRLARTPPSTFLFLHLHLSNSPGSENPSPVAGALLRKILPTKALFRRPHSTANDNRLPSAVDSLILVRSFTGTKTCLGQGPRQRRAQWAVYKPARSALSTVDVNKSSHPATESRTAKKPRFLGT